MDAWKKSSGHNRNMLNDMWQYVGVGGFQYLNESGTVETNWIQVFGYIQE